MAPRPQQVETLFSLDQLVPGTVMLQHAEELPLRAVPTEDPETRRPLGQGERALLAVGRLPINEAASATHLIESLDALAESNQAAGFVSAAALIARRPRIEQRYGSRTNTVAARVGERALEGRLLARFRYFASRGLGRLAIATPDTPLTPVERAARREMNQKWMAFANRYGGTGPEALARREEFTLRLRQQIAEYESSAAENE